MKRNFEDRRISFANNLAVKIQSNQDFKENALPANFQYDEISEERKSVEESEDYDNNLNIMNKGRHLLLGPKPAFDMDSLGNSNNFDTSSN